MNDAKKYRKTTKLEISRTIHLKMGTIKDRNNSDLVEAEEIK